MPTPLATLRSLARSRADQEVNSTLVDDSELDQYLQEGYRHLYEVMAENGALDPLAAVSELTLTSGNTLVVDPGGGARVYRLLGVDAKFGSNFRKLDKLNFRARTVYDNAGSWGLSTRAFYNVVGRDANGHMLITFYPTPGPGQVVRVWFIPMPGAVETDAFVDDTVFLEYIYVHAAVKMCKKEGAWEKVMSLTAELDALEEKIRWTMQTTNHGDSEAIVSLDCEESHPFDHY